VGGGGGGGGGGDTGGGGGGPGGDAVGSVDFFCEKTIRRSQREESALTLSLLNCPSF